MPRDGAELTIPSNQGDQDRVDLLTVLRHEWEWKKGVSSFQGKMN
jgi:hypothetical protein